MVVGVKEGANAHEVVKALITSMLAWRLICFCPGPFFGVAFILGLLQASLKVTLNATF
jgi:hypothetical protein